MQQTRAWACAHAHTCTHTDMPSCTHLYICVHTLTRTRAHTRACAHTHTHTHTHTHRHTHRGEEGMHTIREASRRHPCVLGSVGSGVPYLRPHFEGYKGPSAVTLPRGTARLIRRHIQGIPPPAPFSMGVLDNLNAFFYEGNPPGSAASLNPVEGAQVV